MINPTPTDTTDDIEEVLSEVEIQQIKTKSVTGVVSFFGRTIFLQTIGLISALVLSAFFSPEDFGIYGFVTQIVGLLIFFSDIGLAASLVQKKTKPNLSDYRTAFTVQQILAWLIVFLTLIILSTGLVQQKVGRVGCWILISLAISFPLATFKTIPSVMLERKLEFSKLVVPQVFEQLVFHGLLIFLAWQHFGAMAYAYAIVSRSLVGVMVMWLIKPWHLGLALNKVSLKSLLGFGVKFQLNDFLARIKDQLFYLFLGIILPLKEFGYVQWAKTWSMYPYNLTVQNVMAITFPTYSRLQSRKDLLKKAIEKSIFFICLGIFPILIGMSVFIKPVTMLVVQYQKWQPAIISLVLFTLSIGWSALSTPLVNTLNAIGQINKSLKLMLMWTALTWVLTPLFIWWLGFNGVAVAALLISFTSVLTIYYVNKTVTINVWGNVWRQLLAAGLMALVGVAGLDWWSTSFKALISGGVLTGLVYLITYLSVGYDKLRIELSSLRG